ncbi:hypothetical protein PENSPDRAFT_694343 [Peniophora sp. CONT]|nr:hypothetical protein PENSPDRAFT_694343 [Peniophora sp. CONT]
MASIQEDDLTEWKGFTIPREGIIDEWVPHSSDLTAKRASSPVIYEQSTLTTRKARRRMPHVFQKPNPRIVMDHSRKDKGTREKSNMRSGELKLDRKTRDQATQTNDPDSQKPVYTQALESALATFDAEVLGPRFGDMEKKIDCFRQTSAERTCPKAGCLLDKSRYWALSTDAL